MPAARVHNDHILEQLVPSLPPLPPSKLTHPHDDITLPRLMEALQSRHSVRQVMLDEVSTAAEVLKSMLQQLDRQTSSTGALIQEQNEQLAEDEKLIHSHQAAVERLERRTKVQEQQIDILQRTVEIIEEERRSLLQELEASELRLQMELGAKRLLERRLNTVLTDTQLMWERECERRMNAAVLEMQRKMWLKDETLKQLRAVVFGTGSEDPPHQKQQEEWKPAEEEAPLHQKCGSSSPPPGDVSLTFLEPERNFSPACLTTTANAACGCELQGAPESSADDPSFHCAAMRCSSSGSSVRKGRRVRPWSVKREDIIVSPFEEAEGHTQGETPVRPLHRRFCSSRKKILDHTPSCSLDLGTVLRPSIANTIKVRSPSERDLCRCDRYMLTHQEVASDGEIRTQLIKGEVLQTRGGGRAILFTDIETLKQKVTPVQR